MFHLVAPHVLTPLTIPLRLLCLTTPPRGVGVACLSRSGTEIGGEGGEDLGAAGVRCGHHSEEGQVAANQTRAGQVAHRYAGCFRHRRPDWRGHCPRHSQGAAREPRSSRALPSRCRGRRLGVRGRRPVGHRDHYRGQGVGDPTTDGVVGVEVTDRPAAGQVDPRRRRWPPGGSPISATDLPVCGYCRSATSTTGSGVKPASRRADASARQGALVSRASRGSRGVPRLGRHRRELPEVTGGNRGGSWPPRRLPR